jgi:hypothetical protein
LKRIQIIAIGLAVLAGSIAVLVGYFAKRDTDKMTRAEILQKAREAKQVKSLVKDSDLETKDLQEEIKNES